MPRSLTAAIANGPAAQGMANPAPHDVAGVQEFFAVFGVGNGPAGADGETLDRVAPRLERADLAPDERVAHARVLVGKVGNPRGGCLMFRILLRHQCASVNRYTVALAGGAFRLWPGL
jgi:hypothetical protein